MRVICPTPERAPVIEMIAFLIKAMPTILFIAALIAIGVSYE